MSETLYDTTAAPPPEGHPDRATYLAQLRAEIFGESFGAFFNHEASLTEDPGPRKTEGTWTRIRSWFRNPQV